MSIKELFKVNWVRSFLIIALYVLYAISGTLGEYLFKYALNDIIKGQIDGYIFWQVMCAVMELAAAVLLPIATVFFTRQTQNYLHEIRGEIVQSYYKGQDKKVSEMQNDLSGNLKILTDQYANSWITILSALLQIILSIAVLISMNWILIIVTAFLAVITLLVPKIMEKKTAKATDLVNSQNEKLLNTVLHWISGLDELRRYNAYGRLSQSLKKSSQNLVDANKKNLKYQALSGFFNGIVNMVAQCSMLFAAVMLFFNNIISFGDFVVASGFAFTIFSALWDVTEVVVQIKSSKILREKTFKLRKQPNQSSKIYAHALKVSNLVAKYDQGEVIKYPNFTVKAGEKVLLTGDSGTGKSTLFKILLGKLTPASGEVIYLDKNDRPIDKNKVRIGFVPQEPVVFPVSIKDNILMFNLKLERKLTEIVSKVSLQDDLSKFPAGINTFVDLKQQNLSGGQRQKVVLARSEFHHQPFVLLDEVTSAIDQTTSEKIIDELLHSDQTIVMVAHNLSDEVKSKFDKEIKLDSKQKGDKYES